MSQHKLLSTRLCELDFDLHTSGMNYYLSRLYSELDRAGLPQFRPRAYFGDEWFSPEGSTLISVPFYLAHPKLRHLEKKFAGKVEGASDSEIMRLMRHEAGHCFSHALQLHRTREWKNLFGSAAKKYDVNTYSFNPQSRDYVRHLHDHYAQSHPEEDFAETFAVWLSPRSNWRKRYLRWPVALRKLQYINTIAQQLEGKSFPAKPAKPMSHIRYLRSTIAKYYSRRIRAEHH